MVVDDSIERGLLESNFLGDCIQAGFIDVCNDFFKEWLSHAVTIIQGCIDCQIVYFRDTIVLGN